MMQNRNLPKEEFLKIYNKAHNNACDLLIEANILFSKEKYSRSYFLAFTGLEEIAKSQLAADVFTGFIEEEKFWQGYSSHKTKIERMAWASLDAADYPDYETEGYIDITDPQIRKRMLALYVDIESDQLSSPSNAITKAEAQSLIYTLRVAIERIIEVTEYHGYQIGTKGFMK